LTLDVLLLVSGGLLAILGGGFVLFLIPARYPSFLAAAALISLGLLQFGWARAIYDVGGGQTWFELSLAFALPVSLCWLLLSRTLCVAQQPGLRPIWQIYIVGQGLSAVAAMLFVGLTPTWVAISVVDGATVFPLRLGTIVIVGGVLLNLVLTTASFEATYLSLASKPHRAFRAALLGILLATAYFGYVGVTGLSSGHIASTDIGFGWVPVSILALALPFSLIRGRLVEVRVRREARPLIKTTSLAISIGIIAGMTTLLWITHATGWSIARGLWVLLASGAALGIAALAISNRINRRLRRLIDPYIYRGSIDHREISARVAAAVGQTLSVGELCQIIPANVRQLVGTDPVTLFLADAREPRFIVVSSTLVPPPPVAVLTSEPLATELNRTRRAIHLRGRPDDLEYIPIHVENAAQITACAATCAAPITGSEELFGILICGGQGGAHASERPLLPMLDLICRRYSARFEALAVEGSPSGLSRTAQ
jgi:hypothetical protein